MKFTLNIGSGNEAVIQHPTLFLDSELTLIGKRINRLGDTEGLVKDYNGNTVGSWSLEK